MIYIKKEYIKIIKETNDLMKKVPKINLFGATATTGVYVKAYDDFSQVMFWGTQIINTVFEIEICESILSRKDVDKTEYMAMLERYKDYLNSTFEELKEFIKERIAERWS